MEALEIIVRGWATIGSGCWYAGTRLEALVGSVEMTGFLSSSTASELEGNEPLPVKGITSTGEKMMATLIWTYNQNFKSVVRV